MNETAGIIEEEYATKDLYVAAYLQVKGMKVIRFEKQNDYNNRRKPVFFVFDNKGMCETLEAEFWNGTPEKDFFTALRDLKTRAFSITQNTAQTNNEY